MHRDRARWWMWMLLLIVGGLYAAPIALMVVSSLKSREQLVRDPYQVLPDPLRWENYIDATQGFPFLLGLSNSLMLCAGCVIGTTLSCSLVAYSLARVRWRGRRMAMVLVMITMMLPWHVAMIPRFWLTRELGLYDSLWAIILPTFLGNAFYIFLLRQFFLTIPEELFDAGRMDGLNHWGLYTRIAVPLSLPALAAVALFQFIETWNDFSGPLLYLSDPDKFPLAYSLERFVSSYGDQTHLLLAAAVMFTLPPLMLFFLSQRTFVRGISTTGSKS
jgi:multiple sugar transport system permease protein